MYASLKSTFSQIHKLGPAQVFEQFFLLVLNNMRTFLIFVINRQKHYKNRHTNKINNQINFYYYVKGIIKIFGW